MSLISQMDEATYEAVKIELCPYCRAGLPWTLITLPRGQRWEHSIPRTEHKFECLAATFRNARHDPLDSKESTDA